eukprot:2665407-Pleurochrysis_carterae.AAC.1
MLRRVFERLIAAGMTPKPSKSHLLRKELEVLEYIVTRDGIKANPKKVLRFLGVVNFNRRFIRRIGHLANPLYELLRKDVKESEWPWKPNATDEETCRYKRAYEAVRESLRMD